MSTSPNTKAPLVSTQTKDPWAPTQPYLTGMLPDIQELYQTDTGYMPYSGPTFASMDGRTVDALNSAESIARTGDTLGTNSYDGINQIVANQGLNSGLLGAAGTLGGIADSGGLGTDALYQDIYARASQNGDLENFYNQLRQSDTFSGIASQYGALGTQAAGMNTGAMGTAAGVASGANGITQGSNITSIANNIPYQNQDVQAGMAGVASGANGITTGGQYAGLGATAGTQNAGSLSTLGGVSSGANAINTGQQYAGLGTTAGTQNAGSLGTMDYFSNNNAINTGGAYSGLYNNTYGQNADAQGTMSGVSSGANGINTFGLYGDIFNQAGNPSAADSYLTQMASGQEGIDPRLQRMFDDNAARIGDQAASRLSASGRYGQNAAFADMLGRNITAANDPIALAASEAAKNRQLSATGQIDAARSNLAGQRLSATQGMTGVQGANIANQMAAAQGLAGMRLADSNFSRGLLGDISGIQGQNANISLGAAGQAAGVRNADWQQMLSALQGQTGVQGQNISNQMSAAGQEAGIRSADWQQMLAALSGQTGVQSANLANQMGAWQNLAGVRNADTAQQLGAYGQAAGIEGQNIANQLSGAGLLGSLNNQSLAGQFSALQGQQSATGADLAAQMAGAQQQGALRTADETMRLQAASGLTAARDSGTDNATNAATQEANIYGTGLNRELSAAAMAPTAYQNLYAPSQTLSGIGDAYTAEEQKQINDLINYWNAAEARPWEEVARANALYSGMGALGGTQVNTNPDTSPSTWQTILGGAATGAGILGKISDRRLKRDIERVGTGPLGLPVYEFAYKWDEPGTKRVGYMADEVERVMPEAVTDIGGGFKAVRYDMIGEA